MKNKWSWSQVTPADASSTLLVQTQLSSTLIDSLYLASRLAASYFKLIERLRRLLSPVQGRRLVASRQTLGYDPSGGPERGGGGLHLHLNNSPTPLPK